MYVELVIISIVFPPQFSEKVENLSVLFEIRLVLEIGKIPPFFMIN